MKKLDERKQNSLYEEIMGRFNSLKKEQGYVSSKESLEIIENVLSKHGFEITDYYSTEKIKRIRETKDDDKRKR